MKETTCSIARSLEVLGEKWSLLVIREALSGTTRFSDFQSHLGVSTDILTARLSTLVDAGILERRTYRDEGSRERASYHPTPSGIELRVVLAALAGWGNVHRPGAAGPSPVYRDVRDHAPVRVGFIAQDGTVIDDDFIEVTRVPAASARG